MLLKFNQPFLTLDLGASWFSHPYSAGQTIVTEKRVNPTFKDEPTVGGTGGTVPSLFRVLSAPQRPADAFISVYYRNHWFWVDDRDLTSKQLFSFLMFMFTLTDTGAEEGAPIVTVPTR